MKTSCFKFKIDLYLFVVNSFSLSYAEITFLHLRIYSGVAQVKSRRVLIENQKLTF